MAVRVAVRARGADAELRLDLGHAPIGDTEPEKTDGEEAAVGEGGV